jgi:hypothetical protein
MIARSFRVGPPDDNELLAVQRCGFAPKAVVPRCVSTSCIDVAHEHFPGSSSEGRRALKGGSFVPAGISETKVSLRNFVAADRFPT